MRLAVISETIALVGAITGIVSGVVGTVIAVLSYRRQAVQAPPAQVAPTGLQPATATPVSGPAAPAAGRELRISVKAAVSALLGIVATIYAGLVSLAASFGGDPQQTADLAATAGGFGIVALVLGVMARRDIKRHPERRGKLVSGLGITTATIAVLVAIGAAETEPAASDPIDRGLRIEPNRTTVGQSLSVPPAASAELVAQQIHPQLQAQLQAQVQALFPQVAVTVDGVSCTAADGGGTCTAQARDSTGGSEALEIEYTVVDPSTGAFVWATR